MLERLVFVIVFGAILYLWILPKFKSDMQNVTTTMVQQNQANYQALLAKQAKEKAEKEARLNKPLYVEKIHGGYTLHKADIRTCANSNCSVVGKLDADKMVYWNTVDNGFINYESAYFIKLSDIKPAY